MKLRKSKVFTVIVCILIVAQVMTTVVLAKPDQQTKVVLAATGPLRVSAENGRYFTDGTGKAIFLTGSHTWENRQDLGATAFDYSQYLLQLKQYGHNFIKLWVWEQPKGITTWPDPAQPEATLAPEIFQRTGPGLAADGGLKFDVTQYNQAHFDRLRERIIAAGNQGIYVSIMIFDGWSAEQKAGGANPWLYHPFNQNNNINSLNGDPNQDQSGAETHTLQIPAITQIQEAYVRHVIDTVNDLDNVLFEISNESDIQSTAWQYHMINYIKSYEANLPKQHPVGMTAEWPGGSNSDLFASPADWIAPNGDGGYADNPPVADGSKVVILDTDHIWGIGGDRYWAWKSFTRGYNVIYMDPWDGKFIPVAPNLDLRMNMGYIMSYANRMHLAAMLPHGELCSTGFCLANPSAGSGEYLVYLPSGGNVTVNLAGSSGQFNVEWFNPSSGIVTNGASVTAGTSLNFVTPFTGDAVLYLSYIDPLIPTKTPTDTGTPTNTLPAPTPTQTSSGPFTVGETAVLSTDDSGNRNLLVAQQVWLPQAATLQSLSFYVTNAVGQLRLGIYDDMGGNPGTLRAQTIVFTPTVGWNAQNVSPILLPAGIYWLAYLPQSNSLHFRVNATGLSKYYTYTFGALPTSFSPASASGSFHFSFYATLFMGTLPTSLPTQTALPTNTMTITLTPSNTSTATPTRTSTTIFVNTLTRTPTRTPSKTPTRTPTKTPTMIATRTFTNTPSLVTSTVTNLGTFSIGETNILSSDDSGNGNLLIAQQATLSQSATIQSLSFYVATAVGQLRLGIYSDLNGNPGMLQAQTDAFTPVVGWNTQNVQTPTLLPAGNYWLAYLPQSNSLHFRVELTGVAKYYSYAFGALPAMFLSTPISGTFHFSLYATFIR